MQFDFSYGLLDLIGTGGTIILAFGGFIIAYIVAGKDENE